MAASCLLLLIASDHSLLFFITLFFIPFTMNNTELSFEQLKTCTGGAGWFVPAGYIIAKEGAKAIQFYKDAKANYENGDDVDVAILKAGHSSGTIED